MSETTYKGFGIRVEPIEVFKGLKCFTYTLIYPNGVEIPEPTVFRDRDKAMTHAMKRVDEVLRGAKS